jgi:CPA2 family monovalent cation:H+ antiporter-2
MANQTLIATIVVGLGLAFICGVIAHRLRIPLLIGYLIAGVIIGPFTPGYVADQALALQLAEVGVILLMFGIGLHFSPHDLLSVRAVAIPGAIGQMLIVSTLGFGLARLMGWSAPASYSVSPCRLRALSLCCGPSRNATSSIRTAGASSLAG